jgi:hypothetical protein
MGMNTMRVFLHDLLWRQDAPGFRKRIDQFLTIASRHHIRPLFVLFDSCWDPVPHLGRQHPPVPGVHNSGWVQSPGAKALADPSQYPRLKEYVLGVVGAFANDDRILGWDVWNEPGSFGGGDYAKSELKEADKIARVVALLPQAFAWARQAGATQPLSSAVWDIDISKSDPDIGEIQRIQLRESDVITFHNYSWPESFQAEVSWLRQFHRPVICTEYMARSVGSTFDGTLPIAKQEHVGAINWGFVAGKTQTYYPWESWEHQESATRLVPRSAARRRKAVSPGRGRFDSAVDYSALRTLGRIVQVTKGSGFLRASDVQSVHGARTPNPLEGRHFPRHRGKTDEMAGASLSHLDCCSASSFASAAARLPSHAVRGGANPRRSRKSPLAFD